MVPRISPIRRTVKSGNLFVTSGNKLTIASCEAGSGSESTVELVTTNIEDLRLGQRVVGTNPLREQTHPASDINPAKWRAVELVLHEAGIQYDLAFLRPLSWIETTGAVEGGSIHLELDEMGLNGPAQVTAINPCPEIEPDDGTGRNVVTGRMAHPGANILYLDVTGLDEPLGVTDTHPIWSEIRQNFVKARHLTVGEGFRSLTGESATLTAIHPYRGPPEMVFNLEVDAEHVYTVARHGVLVHNNCTVIKEGGHVSIETGGTATHLTNPRWKGQAVVTEFIESHKGAKYADFVLPNLQGAIDFQKKAIGNAGDFQMGVNSCVTYVADVLKAGGLDVSDLLKTLDDGFWEVLTRLADGD